jgi:hypothetical protein
MERIRAILASCERILAMPAERRRRTSAKGTSPEQVGLTQAHMLVVFWNEALRRGLVDRPLT